MKYEGESEVSNIRSSQCCGKRDLLRVRIYGRVLVVFWSPRGTKLNDDKLILVLMTVS